MIAVKLSNCSTERIVEEQMRRASTSWSIGMLGAIAEFFRTGDDVVTTDGATYAVTGRGAIRIVVNGKTRAVPYATGAGEQTAIALCLPAADCTMHGRRTITEVGPDLAALRREDRTATLFDLGLQSPYFDFCVRTADAQDAQRLREGAGLSLLDPAHGLLPDVAAMNVHRVFISKLGRIEVYQPIARPDERTPEGPHTHLLPSLLKSCRVHDESVPIPEGWVPCATCYCGGGTANHHHAARE